MSEERSVLPGLLALTLHFYEEELRNEWKLMNERNEVIVDEEAQLGL